ncbi:MAG: dihydrofolate reductase [Lachnospiraceae bacterium]|nr:dihydrofolate reductase [Lachnospiraceae bacterium]
MIALIVAYAHENIIGNKGKIPWDIKGEKSRFRELTTGNVVVMGRKSFEEIGKPLPDRTIYVISSTKKFDMEGVHTVTSLKEAMYKAGDRDVFISGGERLYMEAIDIVEKMYITEIDLNVEGDTRFPEFDKSKFIKTIEKVVDGDIPYRYVTYTRKEFSCQVND